MAKDIDYRTVLNHELARRCERNPSYSLRAFARDLGIPVSSFGKVLKYERHISFKYLERLQSIGLSPRDIDSIKRHILRTEHLPHALEVALETVDALTAQTLYRMAGQSAFNVASREEFLNRVGEAYRGLQRLAPDSPRISKSVAIWQSEWGYLLLLSGRSPEALDTLNRAAKPLTKVWEKDPLDGIVVAGLSRLYLHMSYAHFMNGDNRLTTDAVTKSIGIIETAREQGRNSAFAAEDLAFFYAKLGNSLNHDSKDAMKVFRAGIRESEQSRTADDCEFSEKLGCQLHLGLSTSYFRNGEWDLAWQHVDRSLQSGRDFLARRPESLAAKRGLLEPLYHAAKCRVALGYYDEAQKFCTQAIDLATGLLKWDGANSFLNIDYATTLLTTSQVQEAKNNRASARLLKTQALDVLQRCEQTPRVRHRFNEIRKDL